MKILIVEDDGSVARFLTQAMAEADYEVQVVHDGLAAVDAARDPQLDLIVLDVMLPGLNGFEICRRLRTDQVLTPILIITACDALEDKIEGLDSGADDYIVKPFQVAELLARARALLRRRVALPAASGVMSIADLTLDPVTRHVIRGGQAIRLSATEYTLLEHLMRNAGRVLTRAMILDQVWQYDFEGNDNVLDVYISYLRGKVDKGHGIALIHTVRGVGYKMALER